MFPGLGPERLFQSREVGIETLEVGFTHDGRRPFGEGRLHPSPSCKRRAAGLGRADELRAAATDPVGARASERDRMQGVERTLARARIGFVVAALLGLALFVLPSRDWMAATGWALVLIPGLGMGLDGIAERRAERYVEANETGSKSP